MAGRRLERVAHLVQAELARLLVRSARDPRLREVTVTEARMTADLRHARIFFRTFAPADEHAATLAALERASPFLRGEIGRALGLRVVPELHFVYDDSLDTARRVDELLRGAGVPQRGTDDDATDPDGDDT